MVGGIRSCKLTCINARRAKGSLVRVRPIQGAVGTLSNTGRNCVPSSLATVPCSGAAKSRSRSLAAWARCG